MARNVENIVFEAGYITVTFSSGPPVRYPISDFISGDTLALDADTTLTLTIGETAVVTVAAALITLAQDVLCSIDLTVVGDVSLANGDVQVFGWGTVVVEGHHFYMNDDYSCYIGSSANNVLLIGTSAGQVEFRCGPHGAAVMIDDDGLYTAYRIRCLGLVDFGPSNDGSIKLPHKTDPITRPGSGQVWYNSSLGKLQFATATTYETVTSVYAG